MDELIEKTRSFVADILKDEPSSHDISHVERVENLCLKIQETEGGNPHVLRLAAILHDVGVVKEHQEGGDHAVYSAEIAGNFLTEEGVDGETIEHVVSCIRTHRFSRGLNPGSIEGSILQDADRLDALGAVGICRALVSMGTLRGLKHTIGTVKETSMNAYMEDPLDGFEDYMTRKPFKIMDRLNTDTSKEIAKERLVIMETFLEQLRKERCVE
ncbi:HD domain-containing protein [Methanohalophilus sp.]|uniref:HD domain-containing protein n=1 Tax=Methanohalophilus sp. TaxID=1966352 RepID=UPI002621BC7A|nr:HD domain-containing protein [Methanohalophilus sp.]MDK2893101.1 uncharacterized protein [Methanohalophilus sp.]